MNFISMLSSRDLCGLYEITQTGEILYSRVRQKNALLNLKPEIVGKNFFDEVLLFDNAADFRRRVESFWKMTENTQSFFFDLQFADSNLPIKVLLIRVSRFDRINIEKFIIVDIRKSEFVSSSNILQNGQNLYI